MKDERQSVVEKIDRFLNSPRVEKITAYGFGILALLFMILLSVFTPIDNWLLMKMSQGSSLAFSTGRFFFIAPVPVILTYGVMGILGVACAGAVVYVASGIWKLLKK